MPRLLPEWAPQSAVLLAWPRADGDFASALAAIERCYIQIVAAISPHQRVIIICDGNHVPVRLAPRLRSAGARRKNIKWVSAATNDVWIRDYGPLSVATNAGIEPTLFRFNGWGGKYPSRLDAAVAAKMLRSGLSGRASSISSPVVLEGGAVETDGQGTLLATASSLFNPSRNTRAEQLRLRHDLRHKLGLDRWLLLRHGRLAGDDTDGHIDTLARFVNESTIVFQGCDDQTDEHYPLLLAMCEELKTFRRRNGMPYRLRQLPWPRAIFDSAGQRLPANYANFLITNQAVLVPTYNDPADSEAMKIVSAYFPDRKVLGIDCRKLIEQRGSLHCATMQIHF